MDEPAAEVTALVRAREDTDELRTLLLRLLVPAGTMLPEPDGLGT